MVSNNGTKYCLNTFTLSIVLIEIERSNKRCRNTLTSRNTPAKLVRVLMETQASFEIGHILKIA